eukprot:RCo004488
MLSMRVDPPPCLLVETLLRKDLFLRNLVWSGTLLSLTLYSALLLPSSLASSVVLALASPLTVGALCFSASWLHYRGRSTPGFAMLSAAHVVALVFYGVFSRGFGLPIHACLPAAMQFLSSGMTPELRLQLLPMLATVLVPSISFWAELNSGFPLILTISSVGVTLLRARERQHAASSGSAIGFPSASSGGLRGGSMVPLCVAHFRGCPSGRQVLSPKTEPVSGPAEYLLSTSEVPSSLLNAQPVPSSGFSTTNEALIETSASALPLSRPLVLDMERASSTPSTPRRRLSLTQEELVLPPRPEPSIGLPISESGASCQVSIALRGELEDLRRGYDQGAEQWRRTQLELTPVSEEHSYPGCRAQLSMKRRLDEQQARYLRQVESLNQAVTRIKVLRWMLPEGEASTNPRISAPDDSSAARELSDDVGSVQSRSLDAPSSILSVSHDIRTPLTTALTAMQILLLDAPPGDRTGVDTATEDRKDLLQKACIALQSALVLINNVLDYSKLKSARVKPARSKVSIRQLAVGVLRSLDLQAAQQGTELILDASPSLPTTVRCDRVMLQRVLTNLLV